MKYVIIKDTLNKRSEMNGKERCEMSKKATKSAAKKGGTQAKKSTMSKSHIIISLLASLAFSFSFFIVGPWDFIFLSLTEAF